MKRRCFCFLLTTGLACLLTGCAPNTTPRSDAGAAGRRVHTVSPGPNVQEEAQTALIKARPGDIVEFAEGTYDFTMGLSLAVEGVTVRGKGMDRTILSFRNQNAGSEGLLVTRGGFVLEDLTVEDTKGDAVKINGAEGVTLRRVRARWSGEPKETNGAYGLYPVQCRNVLVEECESYGASDAGIYVGQSRNVIVRRCRAERNVAGIEIENCIDADVYENVATDNAGGLLVFDLPGLQVKNGRRVRVFDNQVFANNHRNFAAKGTKVASVPPGTGIMVMATDQVEVFRNTIKDNQTFNLSVVSYHLTGRPIQDKDRDYDPFPEGIYVHGNAFSGGGNAPAGEFGQMLKLLFDLPVPDMLYDGIRDPSKMTDGQLPPELSVYFKNNGAATFANLKWAELGDAARETNPLQALEKITSHRAKIERDLKPYEGELPPLPPVTLPDTP